MLVIIKASLSLSLSLSLDICIHRCLVYCCSMLGRFIPSYLNWAQRTYDPDSSDYYYHTVILIVVFVL